MEQRYILLNIAVGIAQSAYGLHGGVNFAVLAPVPDLSGPFAFFDQNAPHFGVEFPVLATGVQEARVAAQSLVAGVACDAGEGAIDIEDGAVASSNQDAFGGVSKYAGGKLEPLFGLPLFCNVLSEDDESPDGACLLYTSRCV